uniref:Uncharacterized protein n=1 Tax=Streptomyces phage Scarif TaxID=3158858 RepID=A0AAU7GWQ4_9CAUD
MDFKKKIVDTKNKIKQEIKEDPSAAIALASQALGFVAIGMAYHLSNKLAEERRNHAQCHGFANWVVRRAKANGGTEKLLKIDDEGVHITDKPED